MVTRIVGWLMIVQGTVMAVLNSAYMKYQNIMGTNGLTANEEMLYAQKGYVDKGNEGVIGLILIGIAVILLMIAYANKYYKSKEEPEETTDEEKTE